MRNYDSVNPKGRQFPSIRQYQIGPSFHDAPVGNKNSNMVTIMFVSTGNLEDDVCVDEYNEVRTYLIRLIGETIMSFRRGYHCKNFMLAFETPTDAVRFSFQLFNKLRDYEQQQHRLNGGQIVDRECVANDATEEKSKHKNANIDTLSKRIQIGCVHGQYAAMGSNKIDGRADYLGRVVNRAARVAAAATPGKVFYGTFDDDDDHDVVSANKRFTLGNDIQLSLVGSQLLRGIQDEIMLYSCQPYSSNSEFPDSSILIPCQ